MNAVIRLDDKGSPYLIVNYDDREGNEETASDDAERLFFTRLNQNGGLLHLVPGKGKQVRMLVTTGSLKRKASVTESVILGGPEAREEVKTAIREVMQESSNASASPDKELDGLIADVEAELNKGEFPPMHGHEEVPGSTCE
jgi:hypothetical protein